MVVCERCGTANPDGFRFCGGCGAPLPEAVATRQTLKVVTALFCDLVGSTALGEELDPEVFRAVINRYVAQARAIVERHGGTVDRVAGDGVMAVFGVPRVTEDDALRAVRAGSEIREVMPGLARELGVAIRCRLGINTGLVLIGEGENLAIGDAVNVASRLQAAASPDEVLLGSATLRLVRDAVSVDGAGVLQLKGRSEPVQAYRLLAVDRLAPGVARHLDAPLVGRQRELGLVGEAWNLVVREHSCRLFTLLGMAGVGKSRLLAEFLATIEQDATVLRGHCLPYGEAITFWPLAEALMALGQPADVVMERLNRGGAATAEELFWEVRRLLEALARQRPLVLYIDDVQWARPMLLDLLDHVAALSTEAPILLLCAARPELIEERQAWAEGDGNVTAVLLDPLDSADSERLLDQLGDGLAPDARARVIAASEGNPLFLEEMAALARELGTVAVPSTIQALLAARLERLALDERELLERGAVEGAVFHRLAVRALADGRLAAEVEPLLDGLVRKELLRPHPATFPDDQAFRFRHLLIRDCAYEALPKTARAELHARFARWLEVVGRDLVELDEIAGWHLEQAVRYQIELGREPNPATATSAARRLHTAGRRAGARMDTSAARNLLERALALAPAEPEEVGAQIAVDLAEQLLDSYEFERVDELLTRAEDVPAVAGTSALIRLAWVIHARPHEAMERISSGLPAMLERLTRDGDEQGLAKAHMSGQWVHWLAGQATAAGEEARIAAGHAHAAGDERLRARAVSYQLEGLILGRQAASEIERELGEIERAEPGPYLSATIKRGRAAVCRLEGRFEEARALLQRAGDDLAALGMRTVTPYDYMRVAELELAAGDLPAALQALEQGDAALAAQGERAYRSTIQAYLALVHERIGEPDAARSAVDLALQLSVPDDVMNFAIINAVSARLALADGDGEAAVRSARAAVAYTVQTDFLLEQARARMTLADVLAALGRPEEMIAEARLALECYETKGDLPGAARARALLSPSPG